MIKIRGKSAGKRKVDVTVDGKLIVTRTSIGCRQKSYEVCDIRYLSMKQLHSVGHITVFTI